MSTAHETTLPEAIRRAADRWPDGLFASVPGARLTFRQAWARAHQLAERLAAVGVEPGDHVGALMPNSVELIESVLGISLAGAVPVVLNSRYRSDELPYVIEHADLVALLTVEAVESDGAVLDYLDRLEAALPHLAASRGADRMSLAEAPLLRFVAVLGSTSREWARSWQGEASIDDARPGDAKGDRSTITADDPALLLYTSGTTSRPKGCLLSHRALLTAAAESYDRLGITREDVIWNPAPLCHVSAYVALLGALVTGASYVTSSHFEPSLVLDHLDREKVTVAFANFPAFYIGLGQLMQETGRRLPELHTLTTAATVAEIERIRGLFPGVLQLSVTGSTEVAGCACVTGRDEPAEARAATAGQPLPSVEVSIHEQSTGKPLGTGEVGEIWFRGATLLTGYYKDDQPLLTDDGWFRTGDLGVIDEGGRLAFRGRIKDMLKVGGENVAAAEVEAYLLEHPAIEVAQVVAAPDDRLGEVPAAFIQLRSGHTLDEEGVREYCRAGIARFKVPRIVRFVDDWPMSATKIQKGRLRQLLQEEYARSVAGEEVAS
jgi:fatty-acyl-CoA synthase